MRNINDTKRELEKEGSFGRTSDMTSIIIGIISHFKGKEYAEKVKQYIQETAILRYSREQ